MKLGSHEVNRIEHFKQDEISCGEQKDLKLRFKDNDMTFTRST